MRSINLIANRDVKLLDCLPRWQKAFLHVWPRHNRALARRAGHSPSTINEAIIQDENSRVYVFDRPTTVREYCPEELKELVGIVGEPRTFLAFDYTSTDLLLKVLELVRHGNDESTIFVVEDDEGFFPLDSYLERRNRSAPDPC